MEAATEVEAEAMTEAASARAIHNSHTQTEKQSNGDCGLDKFGGSAARQHNGK